MPDSDTGTKRPKLISVSGALPTTARAGDIGRLIAAGRYAEAEETVQRRLAQQPDDVRLLDTLGLCQHHLERYKDAAATFRRVVGLAPDRAASWGRLGAALAASARPDAAAEAFRTGLALDPDSASAQYNLAMMLLQLGRWDEGWRLYEARHRLGDALKIAVPAKVETWRFEPPGRYMLLVRTEQGIGDTIQFARFVAPMRQAGYNVMVWAAPRLAPLLRGVAGMAGIVSGTKISVTGMPAKWCRMMSLPLALGTTPASVPAAPYLTVDEKRIRHWRERIGTGGYRVGIAWQGNARHKDDARRSLPLAALAPLADIRGLRLICLQKEPGRAQIESVPFGRRIEVLDEPESSGESLLDTAAMIMNLDLVVSADTMVAHLAGALGRPVWLALAQPADWRWMASRADTPWYPTMRLFRQVQHGDWPSAIRAMAAMLRAT